MSVLPPPRPAPEWHRHSLEIMDQWFGEVAPVSSVADAWARVCGHAPAPGARSLTPA